MEDLDAELRDAVNELIVLIARAVGDRDIPPQGLSALKSGVWEMVNLPQDAGSTASDIVRNSEQRRAESTPIEELVEQFPSLRRLQSEDADEYAAVSGAILRALGDRPVGAALMDICVLAMVLSGMEIKSTGAVTYVSEEAIEQMARVGRLVIERGPCSRGGMQDDRVVDVCRRYAAFIQRHDLLSRADDWHVGVNARRLCAGEGDLMDLGLVRCWLDHTGLSDPSLLGPLNAGEDLCTTLERYVDLLGNLDYDTLPADLSERVQAVDEILLDLSATSSAVAAGRAMLLELGMDPDMQPLPAPDYLSATLEESIVRADQAIAELTRLRDGGWRLAGRDNYGHHQLRRRTPPEEEDLVTATAPTPLVPDYTLGRLEMATVVPARLIATCSTVTEIIAELVSYRDLLTAAAQQGWHVHVGEETIRAECPTALARPEPFSDN